MKDDIVLLAVTKMLSGFCIGGISLSTGKWVRPVKDHGTILLGDISYPDGSYMQPFDVVRLELISHRPKPPHIEDWTCDFVKSRPELVGRTDDSKREDFLKKHATANAVHNVLAGRCSLSLALPLPTAASFSLDDYSGKYDARVFVPGIEEGRGIPVTDLKWRALGRNLLSARLTPPQSPLGKGGRKTAPSPPAGEGWGEGNSPLLAKEGLGEVKLSAAKLKAELAAERIYLAFGLSRLHEGRCWPLAIGVHTVPDYEVAVDYTGHYRLNSQPWHDILSSKKALVCDLQGLFLSDCSRIAHISFLTVLWRVLGHRQAEQELPYPPEYSGYSGLKLCWGSHALPFLRRGSLTPRLLS